MADLSLAWKGDLELTAGGDLLLADGRDLTIQRIERRLFTVARGLIFHPSYGAGLPQRIGRVARERNIQSLVRGQIALEANVAKIPVPTVKVTESGAQAGLFTIDITYTDAVTGKAVAISLQIPGQA